MAKEDYLIKLSMMEQEAEKLREQINLIEQQILEFNILAESLQKIENSKSKEILSNLGKGVFLKTEIKDSELFVNIGSNVVLKKKPKEAIEIINKQITQLEEMRKIMLNDIEKMNENLQNLVIEARKDNN